MKNFPLLIVAAVLALTLPGWASASTITIAGQLSAFSYWDAGNYMNWFTGYSGVTAGDPYQLKLTFNDAAFVTPAKGGSAFSPAVLTDVEFSIEGLVRMTITTDIKGQALNDVGGKDSLHFVGSPLVSTVTGLDPAWWPGPRGYFNLALYDPTQSAIEVGSPWDFSRFFQSGSFAVGIGFQTGSPYSGGGPQMGAVIQSGSLVLPPSPPSPASVPDSGSTLGVALLGMGMLVTMRRVIRTGGNRTS
jgi:hypothetical protein